ncbi:MAG: PH domain-containing protein [Cyclobacteriaceae bacterium]
MSKKYKSRKNTLMGVGLFLLIVIPYFCVLLNRQITFLSTSGIILSLIGLVTTIVLLAIWFNTFYVINGNELVAKTAVFNYKVNISTIRKIKHKKITLVGDRPALDSNGIIIHYNTFDEIYVSPEGQDEFIQHLKSINPQIEVIENEKKSNSLKI